MRGGDLRRRVALQLRDIAKDEYGQQVPTWADYMTGVPASIEPLSGRALTAAQAVYSEVSHLVQIRYMAALADPIFAAKLRIVYVNAGVTRYFNVGAVINLEERNKELHFYASEGLSLG